MYREILNVDASFGIFTNREQNKSMVIGRSIADNIHIGAIMQSLGGGDIRALARRYSSPLTPMK